MKKNKLFLILLALLAFGQTAWTQNIVSVNYVDENGTTQNVNATSLDDIASVNPDGAIIGSSGFTNWYVVQGNDVVINGQLGFYGGINLILCDGAKLTIDKTDGDAIASLDNTDTKYTLTIYVQAGGTGQLVANASSSAIHTENLTIHGGVITATGGTRGIYAPQNNIVINGGTVTAVAPNGNAIEGYNVTINGGIVSATGNGGIQNGMTGTTTLGYTKNTDRIFATNYLLGYTAASVKVKDGQYMITDNGVIVYGSLNENKRNAIAGRTLSPYNPTEWEGSGDSADDPYIIASVDDLNLLSLRTNGGQLDYSGKYFRLDADLNFTASTDWDDVSTAESNFTAISIFDGHFNGNSHSISGLRLHTSNNFVEQKGLFNYLGSNAYIENLTISNARIAGQTQVGAIAGYVNSGATVTNCHVTGTVTVHAYGHTLENHGGIVGANYGTVSNCVSEATITRSCIANDYGKTGGIVGTNHGTLSGNKVFNANLTVAENYGAIAGLNDGGTLSNNYYHACTVNGTANTVNIGVNGADITTSDGAMSIHTITKPNDVTITTEPTLVYGGTNYWKHGTTITLTGGLGGTPTAGWQKAYSINDVVISENSTTIKDNFNMPATDVTITIGEIHADWANTPNNPTAGSSSDNPYKIYFTDQLDLLATRVNNDNTNTGYAGKYFKLMNNLEYDTTVQNNYIAIGNWNHQFKGCFDGNNDTISGIRINKSGSDTSTDGYQGIFGHIQKSSNQTPSCEVKNLTIDDADITAYDYAGGIVGFLYDGTVTNCHATSTVFVRSTSTSVSRHGGIVGSATAYSYTSEISHCTSSATLTSTNANGSGYGAIAGTVTKYNISLTVSDNLAIGATVPSAYDNKHGAIVGENYQNNSTLAHNYYHNCTVAGEVNTVTKGCQNANVTQSDGAIPVFTVSVPEGVTASATPTVTHNSVNYYKESVPITLTGGLTGETTPGCQKAYVVYGDTLIGSNLAPGHVFNMQNANAVVTVVEVPADWAAEQGAGDTEENPYKIYYIEQLDLLATRVNAGNYYSGKYFKLMNNLTYNYAGLAETASNYTPIGVAAVFKGHFDGNGKTISGIRIYLPNDSYRGLFGRINENAEVKNLTLTDAVITAKNQVGGIVGTMDGGTVTNCCVTSSVTIRAVVNQADYHGGIVGEIYNSNSTISHCASSATLTIENSVSDCSAYGAIVGYIHANAVVRDNFAIGATVPATTKTNDYSHGAIAGEAGVNYTLERNYYHNCKVASASVTPTGVGCGGSYNTADITNEDGAMPVFTLSLTSGISADVDTTLIQGEVNYYKLGTTVALSYTSQPAPGYRHIYSVNGTPIEGDSFVMDANLMGVNVNANVTVAPNQLIDWKDKYAGSEVDPYLIYNEAQWNLLAERVNIGTNYDDKFFKLMEDISITTMVGANTTDKYFAGTFDGNGHKLTVSYNNTTDQHTAAFRNVIGATIKNLHVDGTIETSTYGPGGIVANNYGVTLINCRSSVSITSSRSDAAAGGLIAYTKGSVPTIIEGCVFDGTLTATGDANNFGGFMGWVNCNDGATVSITNSFYKPASTNVTSGCKTFVRSSDTNLNDPNKINITNSYYTETLGTAQGKQAYTITGGENVTVENAGTVTSEATIGVTGYSTGIKYEGVLYAGNGDNVSLNLSVPEGYVISGNYSASAGTLNGSSNPYTLTMPNENVIITADATLTTIYREIEGYGDGTDKWAFIASPVSGSITPEEVTNLIGNAIPGTNPVVYDFDLYRLNPTGTMWENYHAHTSDFNIVNGMGYLYATKETKTLAFSGTFNTGTSMDVTGLPQGFNLVGNPFTVDAYVSKPYYTLNGDGSAILTETSSSVIPPCYGVIVEVGENETVTFNTTGVFSTGPNNGGLNIALTQANTRGASTGSATLLDNAIVSFNEGSQLGKFYFGNQNANIYLPQNGKDYAIAFSDKQGEVPVNFKANENGTYTLSVNPEGVEMGYLHLIDNMTGADVDLLTAGPSTGSGTSYTFTAKTTDYESRFKLVFGVSTPSTGSGTSATFAFVDANGNIVITDGPSTGSGTYTLQIVDVMGRVIVSRDAARNISTSGIPAGVYVLRLIDGNDVKTQRIIIQ